MKIQLTVLETMWMSEAVRRSAQIIKKMEPDSKKVLTLEAIQKKIQGIEIGEDEDENAVFEFDFYPREAKLLRQMAESSAKALTERIIPEYRKRLDEGQQVEEYITSAKNRVQQLKVSAEKFGSIE